MFFGRFPDQRLTSQVHEIVGRINGRFGSVTFVPIHHLASSSSGFCFVPLCQILKDGQLKNTSMVDGNWIIYAKREKRKVGQVDGLLSSKLRGKVSPEDGCLSLVLPCWHLKVNDLLMDLFLWLQDRSLAFHELCALYASTGTFALSASMMPS